MPSTHCWILAVFVIASCADALCAQPEVHYLISGLAPLGTADPNVRTLVGPGDGSFGFVFGPSHFAAAANGPQALVPTPLGSWIPGLPSVLGAQWIATAFVNVSQATALYATSFTVSSTDWISVLLDFYYACDDYLGDTLNQGLFVNGFPVSGTTNGGANNWTVERRLTLEIGGLVAPGTNVLYIYDRDASLNGGIIFGATVTVVRTALSVLSPLQVGGLGVVQIRGTASTWGLPYVILPAASAVTAGNGLVVAPGIEFLLPQSDPLLQYVVANPLSAYLPFSSAGSLSIINGTGAIVVSLPPLASLHGAAIRWQGLLFPPAGSLPIDVTNVITTFIP